MEHREAVEIGCMDFEYPILNEETNEWDIYEPDYKFSFTADTFRKFKANRDFYSFCKQINMLNVMTKDASKNMIKNCPLGLTDKSIIDRADQKQFAFSTVLKNFFKENEPEVYKRLFKKENQEGHLLWNFIMGCSIRAMDEAYNEKFGEKDGEEVMIHISKENGKYKVVEVEVQ